MTISKKEMIKQFKIDNHFGEENSKKCIDCRYFKLTPYRRCFYHNRFFSKPPILKIENENMYGCDQCC